MSERTLRAVPGLGDQGSLPSYLTPRSVLDVLSQIGLATDEPLDFAGGLL